MSDNKCIQAAITSDKYKIILCPELCWKAQKHNKICRKETTILIFCFLARMLKQINK